MRVVSQLGLKRARSREDEDMLNQFVILTSPLLNELRDTELTEIGDGDGLDFSLANALKASDGRSVAIGSSADLTRRGVPLSAVFSGPISSPTSPPEPSNANRPTSPQKWIKTKEESKTAPHPMQPVRPNHESDRKMSP